DSAAHVAAHHGFPDVRARDPRLAMPQVLNAGTIPLGGRRIRPDRQLHVTGDIEDRFLRLHANLGVISRVVERLLSLRGHAALRAAVMNAVTAAAREARSLSRRRDPLRMSLSFPGLVWSRSTLATVPPPASGPPSWMPP